MFSTCNGGPDLKRMLIAGLRHLDTPTGGWELITVDNASSDGSFEVMRSYQDRLPITVLREATPGKNQGA